MSTIWYVILLIFVLTFNQTLIALYEATVSLSFILPHTKAEVIQTSQEKNLSNEPKLIGFYSKTSSMSIWMLDDIYYLPCSFIQMTDTKSKASA